MSVSPVHPSLLRPKSKVKEFFWRRRIWFESTFVFSMLEPWEKILLLTILVASFFLVFTGLFKYLPSHVVFIKRRATYYLWGQEGDESLFWQWLERWYTIGSRKEL